MSLEKVKAFLEKFKGAKIALVAHARPDGDALGSMIGLADALTGRGHEVRIVNPLALPSYLGFLVDASTPGRIVWHESADWWRNYDVLGILDCGEETRLDAANRAAVGHIPAFTVDHHETSGGVGEAVWIEPSASSTGELVVRLCREAGWRLSPEGAQGLWTAIVTDTGRFSFENTTADALEAARDCVLAGADPVTAATHVYQSITFPERRLQRVVLERMRLLENGRLAVSWLDGNDFREAGVGAEGSDTVIDLLRNTAGVEAAVFLYEPTGQTGGNFVKASLRTRSPHDALAVVCQFGGGGHKRAAGCTIEDTIARAREKVTAAAAAAFFPHP